MLRLLLSSLSILIAVAWSPAAHAECPEDGWRSGAPTWVAAGGDEDGIGGSGLGPGDEDGMGGSGVLGTLTGFGSICINGGRIAYDTDVPVTLLGAVRGVAALAVGQVVAVDVEPEAHGGWARAIVVRYAVVGPAEVLGESLVVLGQVIEPLPGAILPAIEMDQRVAVSGLRRPDGTIAASRVDAANPELPDAVRGVLAIDADGGVRVAGVRVAGVLAAVDVDQAFEAVAGAVAMGRWDADSRTLTEASLNLDSLFSTRIERVDIEGYVHNTPDGRLSIGELIFAAEDLIAPGTADRSGDAAALIESGARVRIEALRSSAGAFEVRRVWIVRERELMRAVDRAASAPIPSSQSGPMRRWRGYGHHPRAPDDEFQRESDHRGSSPSADRPQPERPQFERPELFERPEHPEPPGDWGFPRHQHRLRR